MFAQICAFERVRKAQSMDAHSARKPIGKGSSICSRFSLQFGAYMCDACVTPGKISDGWILASPTPVAAVK
jgi:hypothetical protein